MTGGRWARRVAAPVGIAALAELVLVRLGHTYGSTRAERRPLRATTSWPGRLS